MATLLIDPFTVDTKGGYPARITGLDPSTGDCIIGTLQPAGVPQTNASWNLDGTIRDQSDSCNLDMSDPQLEDLAALARHLGAPE